MENKECPICGMPVGLLDGVCIDCQNKESAVDEPQQVEQNKTAIGIMYEVLEGLGIARRCEAYEDVGGHIGDRLEDVWLVGDGSIGQMIPLEVAERIAITVAKEFNRPDKPQD